MGQHVDVQGLCLLLMSHRSLVTSFKITRLDLFMLPNFVTLLFIVVVIESAVLVARDLFT
jgi:hypothetical protein